MTDGFDPCAWEDEPDWAALTAAELKVLALGTDVRFSAIALRLLGQEYPAVAKPVALEVLNGPDVLDAAAALEVLAAIDLDEALVYMCNTALGCPRRLFQRMVEILAVNHPIPVDRYPQLLTALAQRLATADPPEHQLAELFYFQYPLLRPHER